MTTNETQQTKKPTVLIVGGGLGGLTLAILLKKADIPFKVFERSIEIKQLGSAISLGAGVSPLFMQMGIYDEFEQLSKPYDQVHIYDEDLNPEFTMDGTWIENVSSYREYIISRPVLYDLLWRHVPRENIHTGKTIVSFEQDKDGVTIECQDGTSYSGDILVGSDGVYSTVRQHLYKTLREQGTLPASDDVPLPYNCVCLVGQTKALDPEEFPEMKGDRSQVNSVLGITNMCTWATHTTKQNTYCWSSIMYLDKETTKANVSSPSASEWDPEAAEAMSREVRNYKVPGGKDGKVRTLGDYIDLSAPSDIAKVMLEEKMFETWYSGRTVLIGDACHMMDPTGGTGALTAMCDAVTFANWISTVKEPTVANLEAVFKEYRDERYPVAKEAFTSSQMFSKCFGKSFSSMCMRGIMKRLPGWLWRMIVTKNQLAVRAQASFLPLIEEKSSVKAAYQPSLDKTLAILAAQS
ncbi:hypothetical protein BGZ94_000216 [Podila epigama]|nr:hypothetical protein BGZ94_000216 [Podila epigama]